jgi:hypothetical protein
MSHLTCFVADLEVYAYVIVADTKKGFFPNANATGWTMLGIQMAFIR